MLRIRTMIALAVLGALAVVALAIPAMAHDDDNRTDHHRSGGGLDRSDLGSGGKLTLKLLERGESQSLAEVYADEHTGGKVKRAMRSGLRVHCQPGGFDTLSFTCELETTTPLTTVPQTTTPFFATASASATASAPATTP